MSNIPEVNHHYWSTKCSKCGIINKGRVTFDIFCYNCQGPLVLFDIYSQSDVKDLFISPEALQKLKNWVSSDIPPHLKNIYSKYSQGKDSGTIGKLEDESYLIKNGIIPKDLEE